MNPISSVINNQQDPIANRNKSLKPIANSLLVDQLLADYSSLIDVNYTKWFAARFYKLSPDRVSQCASEAKADGRNQQRLFAFLINKATQGLQN